MMTPRSRVLRLMKAVGFACFLVASPIPCPASTRVIDLVGVTGDADLITAPSSVKPGALVDLVVFQESKGHVLTKDIDVDLVHEGRYGTASVSPSTPVASQLLAGTRVSSYFVHLDGDSSGTSPWNVLLSFDEPILGVILSRANLDASDDELGAPGTDYPRGLYKRGLGLNPSDPAPDGVHFTDRYWIFFTMDEASRVDQIRVITGPQISFSLDIGSGRSFSDSVLDGNEIFDSGDMSLSGGAGEPQTIWDDVDFLAATLPDAPDPAPFGACFSGGGREYFDLDAFDSIPVDPRDYAVRPILEIVVEQQQPGLGLGIHGLERLLISYDDDTQPGYPACDSTGAPSSLPNTSASPAGATYGQTGNRDEVQRIHIAGGAYPRSWSRTGGFDEDEIHSELAVNARTSQFADDDIDALDWMAMPGGAFFSADHEAKGAFGSGVVLDPGTIYSVFPGDNDQQNEAVRPQALGLDPGCDVDAFEFVWLHVDPEDEASARALAVLFSVDGDDVLTVGVDESGGLDPSVIYGSYMDGFHFVVSGPFADDIDGIAALPEQDRLGRDFCNGDGGVTADCSACPCENDAMRGAIGGCLNDAGRSARLDASGSSSLGDSDLSFSMIAGGANSFAVLVSGSSAAPANPANFCYGLDSGVNSSSLDGLRCVVEGLDRHGARALDARGDTLVPWRIFSPDSAPPADLQPGDRRYFQAIYRQVPAGGCGTGQSSTQGIEIVFSP